MRWSIFGGALAVVLMLGSASRAAVISLLPARDNTLIQRVDRSNQLSNGLGDIFSGRTNQDPDRNAPGVISIRRGLIYFDIAASLPSWATVTDVKLTMRDQMGLNGDRLTTLHRVQQDWGEGASFQNGGMGGPARQNDATWFYRFYDEANPLAGPEWNTPGGDFDAAASGSTIVSDDLGGGQYFSWVGAGMVSDVQNWLDNPATNFGWLIRGDESVGQTAKRFNGRTNFNESTQQVFPHPTPPVLMVTYIPEPETLVLAVVSLAGVAMTGRKPRILV